MKRVAFAASCVRSDENDDHHHLLLDPTAREETAANQFLAVFDPSAPDSSLYLNHSGRFSLEEVSEVSKFLYENGVCRVNESVTAALRQRFE